MSLRGKLSLITGSTSGIGLAIAQSLAKEGSNIIFNGRSKNLKDEVLIISKDLKEKYDIKTYYFSSNLSQLSDINKLIEYSEFLGGVDILVNNAGIQHVSPIESFPTDKWDEIISVHLTAPFHTIKGVLPKMKKNNWGRIINIASVHGSIASKNKSAYVAAKHGLLGLTKVVALETAETGITCNSISPGWVLTPLVEKQIMDRTLVSNSNFSEESHKLLIEKQPSGKFANADSIGNIVVFMCSNNCAEVRGANWSVDGGWTIQ